MHDEDSIVEHARVVEHHGIGGVATPQDIDGADLQFDRSSLPRIPAERR